MPSHLHEALVDLFRRRPELAAEMLSGPLHIDLPAWEEARPEPNELTAWPPTAYSADMVVAFRTAGRPVQAVVVEVTWCWPLCRRRYGAHRRD